MESVDIQIEATYSLEYDIESKEFKEALESYKQCIEKDGDEYDMLKHVVHNMNKWGADTMVEGVGYVKRKNRNEPYGEPYSGIQVVDDNPDFEYMIV